MIIWGYIPVERNTRGSSTEGVPSCVFTMQDNEISISQRTVATEPCFLL